MKPYMNLAEANLKLRQENERLLAENARLRGDVDYLAIMTDVDLETDEAVEETADEENAEGEV